MSEHGFLSPNPALLYELEQLKKRPGLAHELGQGAPCLRCGEKCPGFQLHYWRKVCMNCRCGKAEHNVIDQSDPGFFIVGKLFDRPLRTKAEELHFVYGDVFDGSFDTSQAGLEIKLDWVPPGTASNVVAKYLKSMPQQYVSIQGSEGAQRRKKQLEKQFPIHDVEPTNCHELSTKEIETMQSYVESVRQNIAGQGKVLELGSVNGTGFSVNSMHSTSSTAAAHGVHNSNNSTAHGVHNSNNSTAAAPSVHSSGYHSSTSSQDDNIPAWCKEDEGTYGNIPPPPPEILLGGGGAGYAERSGSESPPPPPLPSSMPPRLSGINLKEKFDAIGLSGRNGPNSSGMYHATPLLTSPPGSSSGIGSRLEGPSDGNPRYAGSTGSSIPSNSSSPSPPKTSPSYRSEIHREIPAFIGLSPSPPPLNLDNLHIGTNFQGAGRSSNGLGSPNILPTAPKPTSNLVKPAKLFNNQNGGGLNGTERNGVVENVGHGGQFNGSTGSNKTDNGQGATWHCSGCGEMMLPGAVAIFAERAGQDKCWHPSCFSCCSCGELLEDLLYFFSKGKLYCGRDFAAMMDIPRCAACDELIFATEYTGAEDQYWHLKHFCCFVCDSPLAGHKYIPVNGQPHCLNCWQNVHGKICNSCQSYIHPEDQRVTLGDSHWHAKSECFKCGVCSKSLLGGKMTRRDGTLLCSSTCAAQLSQQRNQPAVAPQFNAAKQSRQPSSSPIMAPNLSSQQQKQSTPPSLGSPRNSSSQSLGNKLPSSSSSNSHLSYGGSSISNGGHYVPTGQILGNRPGPQVPSLATRVSSSSLSSAKPSSPRPLGSSILGSALRGSSSTIVSSNPSSPGPLNSPSYSHAYGGHMAGSPTPMNHRNTPVSPPPPPPKPGLQAGGNLLPYQPLLHVQQQKPSVHQNGRHVQFASSTRPAHDQSSDGYSSNHSTPPFHSRESSYSTIV